MTWVKLSDTLAEDPRLEAAGPLALALHVAALCYCSRQLTDGAIPGRTVRRLLDLDDPDQTAKSLVEAGMWEETADGFLIVDYLSDQPSREHVEAVRMKRAESGRAGGRASGTSRRIKIEATSKQSAQSVLEHPARPGPTQKEGGRARTCATHAGAENPPPCIACRDARLAADQAEQTTHQRLRSARRCDHDKPDGMTIKGVGEHASRVCPRCESENPAGAS